jgi:ferric-dicitrate binding protein FerR (iron transport regulator)
VILMANEQKSIAPMDKRLRRQAGREAREAERERETRRRRSQRLASRGIAVLVVGGLVVGIGWWVFQP